MNFSPLWFFSRLAVILLLLCGSAAGEIVSVKVETANIRSSPSVIGSYVLIQAPRYYPLSVRGKKLDFIRVRDYQGVEGWVKNSLVSSEKGIVVDVKRANVRKGPGKHHPVVFRAYKGVAFKVLEERKEWLHVRHENGREGWINKSLIWGR